VDFNDAYAATMRREGGYQLHQVAGDTGGMTYAGIARNKNPHWQGWAYVDRKETPPTAMVRDFYRVMYWDEIAGDKLRYDIASSIYDFGVNAGTGTAIKLAQIVARVAPDGVMGPVTINALHQMSVNAFELGYFAAKVKRYAEVVSRDRSQAKFLLGWLNRSLGSLS